MKKRIGLISGDITGGLAFQRGHIYMRHLKDEFEFVPMSMHECDHASMLYLDAAILYHPCTEEQLAVLHRATNHYQIPIIVDIDDLLTDLPVDHPEYRLFRGTKVVPILSRADHVVVSTDYLRKTWGHLNQNMSVIENVVDMRRYKKLLDVAKPYHSGFTVGYTGGQSHRPDLYNTGFIEGLEKFMEKYEDVRAHFHILCPQKLVDRFGSRVIFTENVVDYLDYPSMCATFAWDLCVVPLQNHPFNDAKSDLRLLDMSVFKIPVLASPRADFIRHLEKKRLGIALDGCWFGALEYAYLNREEVESAASNAFDYVTTERTAQVGAEKWRALLRGLTRSDPPTPA